MAWSSVCVARAKVMAFCIVMLTQLWDPQARLDQSTMSPQLPPGNRIIPAPIKLTAWL